MRRLRTLGLGLLGLLASCGAMIGPAYPADLHSVRYVSCYDGDTCRVIVPYLPEPFTTLTVRLTGIDTAEINAKCPQEQALATQAKLATNGWMQNAKTIDLLDVKQGLYGRVQAKVLLNDRVTVQSLLLKSKLAVTSEGKRTQDWCAEK